MTQKCSGERCPMQYPYDVENCGITSECIYYTAAAVENSCKFCHMEKLVGGMMDNLSDAISKLAEEENV